MIGYQEVVTWLEKAPTGLTVRFRNMDLRKTPTGWYCPMGQASRIMLVGNTYTSDEVAQTLDLFRTPTPPPIPPEIWVTKNGRHINIADLDDGHLVNVCKFLRPRLVTLYRKHLGNILGSADPDTMGEHAYDAVMEEEQALFNRMASKTEPTATEFKQAVKWHPQVPLLVAEIHKRGLADQFGEESLLTDVASYDGYKTEFCQAKAAGKASCGDLIEGHWARCSRPEGHTAPHAALDDNHNTVTEW